jgi:hypothetical protein
MGWLLSNIVVALEKHYNRTPGLQEATAKRFDEGVRLVHNHSVTGDVVNYKT